MTKKEIIRDLEEEVADNKEAFEDEGDVYRLGKADAFAEAIEILRTQCLQREETKELIQKLMLVPLDPYYLTSKERDEIIKKLEE